MKDKLEGLSQNAKHKDKDVEEKDKKMEDQFRIFNIMGMFWKERLEELEVRQTAEGITQDISSENTGLQIKRTGKKSRPTLIDPLQDTSS